MGALLWSGARRVGPNAPGERTAAAPAGLPLTEARTGGVSPAEERVQALLASAAEGDVPGYLAAFTGPLKHRLAREVDERGRAVFADDLRRAALARKSHAVFAAEPDGPDAARVTVEAVYADRNERQTYRLERGGTDWLVSGVETLKGHQPSSKYGSPAVFVAPEGVPVPAQGGVTVETGDNTGPPRG
jgi:hypothetical protein